MTVDLWLTAQVEVALYVYLGLWGVVHSGWTRRTLRAEKPRLDQAQTDLARFLSLGGEPPDLSQLARATQVDILLRLSASLQGASTEKLQQLAQSLGHIQRAQRQLRSRFWWVRLGGLRFFSGLGKVPDQLERCLHDPHPLVRAEAIYLVPQEPTSERVSRVVRELFAPASLARFASHSVLVELSGLAENPLLGYLAAPPADCESVELALRAACCLASPALVDPALHYSASPDPKIQQAAAHLLGCIGGQASIERLLGMLEGPSRAAAAEALGHLVYWQAAPRLALMLQDLTYDVRYQAALALRQLGPPGLLFLRQAGQQDHLGASVARLVLSQC